MWGGNVNELGVELEARAVTSSVSTYFGSPTFIRST